MITTTRWSPDTCDCVLEYEWDTEVSEDLRVHTPKEPVRVCDDHKVNPKPEVHDKVHEENTRKNKALDEAIKALPSFAKTDAGGNKTPDLDKIAWSFDEDRNLVIDLKGAKKADKDAVKAVVSAKLSKVNIL